MHTPNVDVNAGFRLWRDRLKMVHVSPMHKRTHCNRNPAYFDYLGTEGTPTCLECLAAR